MPCVDSPSRAPGFALLMGAVLAAVLAGCSTPPQPQPSHPKPAPTPAPQPSRPVPRPVEPAVEERSSILPAPARPRSAEELRLQAARRLVAANPGATYTGKPPELLLAIPVISIELNADGSVKTISVLRHPSQARETEDIARMAILRAAPYGDVSALPKPWKFTETFLFNNDRKFKPMTLDQIK